MDQILRTPDDRFNSLPGFDFAPNYVDVDWPELDAIRMHYLDLGPSDGACVLLLHGEPSWCYLYRKMIPPLIDAGFRCIAPDLIGFGRSDKPARREDYSYRSHLVALRQFVEALELTDVNLFCQDWGGLLGLRLVAEQPALFSSVCASNTMLPDASHPPSEAFLKWREFSQTVPKFPVGGVIRGATVRPLSSAVEAAYNAPFPDESYKAGVRQFPLLVPVEEGMPEVAENRTAWQHLAQFDRPFLTLFSDQDPVTAGGDRLIQARIPGCQGQPHATIKQGGHFVQEDAGEALAVHLVNWLRSVLTQ